MIKIINLKKNANFMQFFIDMFWFTRYNNEHILKVFGKGERDMRNSTMAMMEMCMCRRVLLCVLSVIK